MRSLKILLLVVAGIICAAAVQGQEIEPKHKYVDFSVQLKSMHLWRGLQVADVATTAVDLGFTSKNGNFTAGIWGGAGLNGAFREFDYYLAYSVKGFTFALWDIYNFSPGADYNIDNVFNYKSRQTGHFIDLSVAYRFQGNFPLGISWATVIHGRDRGTDNRKNLYSTYVYADYPVLRDRFVDLDVGVGGAFALDKQSGTKEFFYGRNPGIVNISIIASKDIHLGKWVVPLSAQAMWNPVNKNANIQVAATLFSW